jgi:hypothetical protein
VVIGLLLFYPKANGEVDNILWGNYHERYKGYTIDQLNIRLDELNNKNQTGNAIGIEKSEIRRLIKSKSKALQ